MTDHTMNRTNRQPALHAMIFLLHVAVLAVLARATLDFMALPSEPRTWIIALALATIPSLALARPRIAQNVLAVSFGLAALWAVIGTVSWPDAVATVTHFLARWVVFLVEAYWGTLSKVPPDIGQFTVWLLMFGLAWWGWSQIRRGTTWLVLVPAFAYILFQWFFHFDDADYYLRILMVPAFLLLALHYGQQWYAQDADEVIQGFPITSAVAAVTALVLVVMLVATTIPLEGDPWSLATIRRWFTDRFPTLERVRGGPQTGAYNINWFTISTSGFGSSARLGGPVSLDTSTAFEAEVRALGRTADDLPFPLYFQGRTLTRYTGRGWESPEVEGWEWYEFGQWLPREIPTGVRSLRVIQEIRPIDLRTHTLFGIGDVREVGLDREDDEEDHPYYGHEILGKNTMGDVLVNLANPLQETYRVMSHLPFWEVGQGDPPAENEELSDRDRYVALPSDFPEEIRELAEDITDDTEDEFEAADALVDYLREIPYSLEVAPPPEDQDFAAHFLFETREGYCTYHATALAVMLRSIDIPARWVQGFIGSRDDFTRVDEEDDVIRYKGEITHATAHAWVEAWIPGYGWIPLEPTPAYQPVDHARALERDPVDPGDTPARDEFEDELWPFEGDMDEEDFGFDDTEIDPREDAGPPLWQRILRGLGYSMVALLVGGGASLHYVTVNREREIGERAAARILNQRKHPKDGPAEYTARVLGATDLAIHYLARSLDLSPVGMTGREFTRAVEARSHKLGAAMATLVSNSERAAYGGQLMYEQEAAEAQEVLEFIRNTIRKERGGITYLKMRYLPEIEINGNGNGSRANQADS